MRLCSLNGNHADDLQGTCGLGRVGLRTLDVPQDDSDSDSDAARLARASSLAQRRLSGGRLHRTVSAPTPPLMSMLSRTGTSLVSKDQSFCRHFIVWGSSLPVNQD